MFVYIFVYIRLDKRQTCVLLAKLYRAKQA